MQSERFSFRFSLSTLLGAITYFALLLGVWKYVGWPWVSLLAGHLLLLILLCATKIWRRLPITCPACKQTIPGMLFVKYHPCLKCGEAIQADHRASELASITFFLVIALTLPCLTDQTLYPYNAVVLAANIGLLAIAGRYYTRARLADEPQESLRDWARKHIDALPDQRGTFKPRQYWLMFAIVLTLVSAAALITFTYQSKSWVAGALMMWQFGSFITVCGLGIYFSMLDLFVFRPVRVPKRGEIWSKYRIFTISLVATLALLHSGFSATVWGMFTLMPNMLTFEYAIPYIWICFLMLAMSTLAFVQALRRRKSAQWILALTLVTAGLCFSYDAANRRYQMSFFGSKEYWDNGGRGYIYFNWPFYDPR